MNTGLKMKDPFLNKQVALQRLINKYNEHKHLFVMFDFDHTVFDYDSNGSTFPYVENLLRRCIALGDKISLILFTAREGEKLNFAIDYCIQHGYPPKHVNTNPIMPTRKPYCNILLDDTAGLGETCWILNEALKLIEYEEKE